MSFDGAMVKEGVT